MNEPAGHVTGVMRRGGGGLPQGGELNAAVTRAVVRYHSERAGRGPTKAQTFYRGDVLVVMLEDSLTKAEQTLAAGGRADAVVHMRDAFQDAMRADLVQTVEQLTGCTVRASMSTMSVEPDIAAELFVLDQPIGRC